MSFPRARFLVALLAALCLLTFALSCSRDDDDDDVAADDAAETPALTPYKPSGNEGTVTGVVSFVGAAPAAKPIGMGADPVCEAKNKNPMAEDIVIKEGGAIQNVFVYVKDGKTADNKNINSLGFDVPAQPQVLDQNGCHYVPHVIGIQVKQQLSITNSDATTHNINLQANKNEKFNQSQSPGTAPIVKTFGRAETLIPVKCNQHPWMKAYVGVVNNPFYAVSGPDGKFEIKGLPPGTYTIVAWHEKFGDKVQTQSVTVGAKGSAQADFKFTAEQMTAELQGGPLYVMPALEVPMLGEQH